MTDNDVDKSTMNKLLQLIKEGILNINDIQGNQPNQQPMMMGNMGNQQPMMMGNPQGVPMNFQYNMGIPQGGQMAAPQQFGTGQINPQIIPMGNAQGDQTNQQQFPFGNQQGNQGDQTNQQQFPFGNQQGNQVNQQGNQVNQQQFPFGSPQDNQVNQQGNQTNQQQFPLGSPQGNQANQQFPFASPQGQQLNQQTVFVSSPSQQQQTGTGGMYQAQMYGQAQMWGGYNFYPIGPFQPINPPVFPNPNPPAQPDQSPGGNFWTLSFEGKSAPLKIQISSDKTIEEAINHYRIKSGDMVSTRFTSGGKPLAQNLKLSESGLQNNAVIHVEASNATSQPQFFSSQGDKFNLIFEQKAGGQTLTIQIQPNKTVADAINAYKNKVLNQGEMKFIFNGQNLDTSLTLHEAGLKNGSKILVISTKDIEGA